MTPLRAIRFAMLAGVLLFGVVALVITRSPDWTAPEAAVVGQLTWLARIAWVAAGVALVVLFTRFRGSEKPATASNVAIISWAVGEMLALFGGAFFFITASPGWYIAGVTALALTFVAFPPPVNR